MKIGIEAEGKLKGLKTLFIGRLDAEDKNQVDAVVKECHHLYFGADKTRVPEAMDAYNFFYDKDYTHDRLITFEVRDDELDKLPGEVLANCHIMVRVEAVGEFNLLKETDTIKIESLNTIYCSMQGQFIKNDISYLTDREV